MDSKKTTIALSILLFILLALLFLRAGGISLPFISRPVNNNSSQGSSVSLEESSKQGQISTAAVSAVSAKQPDAPAASSPKPAAASSKMPAVFAPVAKDAIAEKPAEPEDRAEVPKVRAAKPQTETQIPASIVAGPQKKDEQSFANKSKFKVFYVYKDAGSKDNHYFPYAFMGDIGALNLAQGSKDRPRAGDTCIKVTYYSNRGGAGWAGVYWTEPANNWGDKGLGFNLKGAERISFWARGATGKEIINNFIMGGIQGKEFEDSDYKAVGPIALTTDWKQYSIDLKDANLANIIGGFCVTMTKNDNPEGAVFYLDDIEYE